MQQPADPQKRLDELAGHLLDEDEETRYAAARELNQLGRPALERAVELAQDARPRLRELACYVLGQVRDLSVPQEPLHPVYDRTGVPVLLRLLQDDPDEEVRGAAAAALGFQAVPATL